MKSPLIMMGMIFLSLCFTSCDQDNVNPVNTAAAEANAAAFTDLAILSANNTASIDSAGVPKGDCKLTEISTSALPASVSTYITNNYAGANIERAGTNQAGNYVVGIKKADGTPAGLMFTSAGEFIAEKALPPHPDRGTPIAVSALPTAVTTYVTENYAGATIEHADQKADGTYMVLIKKTDATLLGLAFDAAGKFLTQLPPPPKGHGHHGKGPRDGHHHRR